MLAGVAGGMAEYLDLDPTVVRILWILMGVFSGGLALIAYVILALVIPPTPIWATPAGMPGPAAPGGWTAQGAWAAPGTPPAAPAWGSDWAARSAIEQEARHRARGRGPGIGAIVGVVLIVFGAIALADAVLPAWSGAVLLGPAVIIALGAALLVGAIRTREEPAPAAPAATEPVAGPAPTGGWEATDTQTVDSAPLAASDESQDAGGPPRA
jgi:phage shock protein C